MSHTERNTWLYGGIAIVGWALYLALVLPRLLGASAETVAYVGPLLWTVGGAVVAGIVAGIGLGALAPKGEPLADVRDVEIDRLGDRIGRGALIAGAVFALALALFEAAHFWIANAIYLGFVAQAVLSSIVRILAYRGVIRW